MTVSRLVGEDFILDTTETDAGTLWLASRGHSTKQALYFKFQFSRITLIFACTVRDTKVVTLLSFVLYHNRHHTLSGPLVFVAPITLTDLCPLRLSKKAENTKNLNLKYYFLAEKLLKRRLVVT
jgi:hypothetical protein